LHCPIVLPLAPSVLSLAPSLLPLKQPCSLSRTKTAIPDPQFGAYIMYIYILVNHSRKQEKKKKRKKSPSNLAIHLYSSPLQLALQAACLVLGAGGKEDEEKLRVEDGEKGCAKTETILVISPSFCIGEIRSVLFS